MKKQMVSFCSGLVGIALGIIGMRKYVYLEINKVKDMSNKHLGMFLLMNQWVHIKQQGKSLEDYLAKNHYRTIAVYGMSYVGETFIDELKESQIKIAYGIDRNAGGINTDVNVVTPDGFLEDVDAVIVTSVFFMDEIERQLSQKLSCPIISLQEMLYEM